MNRQPVVPVKNGKKRNGNNQTVHHRPENSVNVKNVVKKHGEMTKLVVNLALTTGSATGCV